MSTKPPSIRISLSGHGYSEKFSLQRFSAQMSIATRRFFESRGQTQMTFADGNKAFALQQSAEKRKREKESTPSNPVAPKVSNKSPSIQKPKRTLAERKAWRHEYQNRLRADKLARGECRTCPNKAKPGIVRCKACAAKQAAYNTRRSNNPTACQDRARKERRANGLCALCGKVETAGRFACPRCEEKTNESQKRNKRKKVAMGICRNCPEKAVEGKRLCAPCNVRALESSRQSRARRKGLTIAPLPDDKNTPEIN